MCIVGTAVEAGSSSVVAVSWEEEGAGMTAKAHGAAVGGGENL